VVAPTTLAFAWLLIGGGAWAQEGSQVLAEVGIVGENSSGDAVVRPDFNDAKTGDYNNWVAPTGGRDFRGFAISPKGSALVLDGNMIREFSFSGAPRTNAGFPINCTALLFNRPKRNGQPDFQSLSECTAFTVRIDGVVLIAGEAQGGGFVLTKSVYDPETMTWETTLAADGTPPSISDLDCDEYADSDDRLGEGCWAVGDRKKVIFFPNDDEQNYNVVSTLNGERIDSVTPFLTMSSGPGGRVVVALDTGELLEINTDTGAATAGPVLSSAADCGLGRKDPQRYSVRGDPSGILFAGNRGGNSMGNCNAITLFDAYLVEIDESTNESLVANPFILANSSAGADPFLVESLDWQSGQGGDFTEGCDDPLALGGCQFGAIQNQAIMFDVQVAQGVQFDTTYRMFQFVDLVDCRHSGDRPCPILNPADPVEKQVLNLTGLLLAADETGVFRQLAFGDLPDEDLPVMAIPEWMRGEATYPDSNGDPVNNNYKFVSFFAVTDAIFQKTFFVDYQIDLFRFDDSHDPCVIPPAESTIADVNETANLIVYNSGDGFGTVDRGGVQGTRGAVIGNSFCNGGASRARWSANTIGLEFHEDDNEFLYIEQVTRMANELEDVRRDLLCSPFPNPAGGPDLGPLLDPTGPDCSNLENDLHQVIIKLATCTSAQLYPIQGNSAENCNAFFTQVQNLRNAAAGAAWPTPATVSDIDVLRPNYEGEFLARIDALVFFVESYMLNAVPAGGAGAP
jgi:hypothetical protein